MARVLDLPTIDQGAAYKHSFFWFDVPDPEHQPDQMVPISLTGFEGLLQIRTEAGLFTAESLLAEWSTANSKLVFIDNEVRIFVPRSLTNGYVFEEGYYDLLVWPTANPEDVTRLVQGQVRTSLGCSKVV